MNTSVTKAQKSSAVRVLAGCGARAAVPAHRIPAAPHAHELGQFRQRRFVGFLAVARIDAGTRDLGQIAHDLAQLSRQALRIGGTAGAKAIQEPGAP
jgi:hypothetical protein